MVTDDDDTCTSKAPQESSTNSRQQRRKLEVYNDVLQKLKDSHHPDAQLPAFDDQLWAHFNRLPLRYALDVNVDTPEDVLAHKRLLHLAQDPANRPALEVRLVQVPNISDGNSASSSHPNSPLKEVVRSIHPPPAFGSSPNLEALALESSKSHNEEGEIIENNDVRVSRLSYWRYCRPLHEITFSTDDRQKLLCQLSSLLSEIGLNIQEAHAFSTSDGYSLNVFVVDGWPYEEIELLRSAIEKGLLDIEQCRPNQLSSFTLGGYEKVEIKCKLDQLAIPSDGTDVWEIEPQHVKFGSKIASGSYGDLFKGVYYGQEVAIKILKADRLKTELLKEFAQEVYIMRKVRHKNVVQFIGACTKPPSLCIVTEFMSGGSVYDYLHKQKGVFKLPILLKVAIDISKGMDYLHQNNIIHRDLKTANLLLDENDVVKVADFGVARVRAQTGVMTAETGTYRWMAPEVTEHKPYDHKADVFSFGILLWELLTGKIPYEYLTPIQAAIAVVQKDLRPTIPKHTHPKLGELIEKCWLKDSTLRPNFGEIIGILQQISKEVGDEGDDRKKDKRGGFFNSLRRGHY